MNSKKSLLLGQGIFTIILIVSLGLIVVSEKGNILLKNKADKAITNYLETKYKELLPSLNTEEIKINNSIYSKKIVSKDNKNHFFYVKYEKKQITDTYQKDYEEGDSILNHIKTKLEKEIQKKTKINCMIQPTTSLNDYSTSVKERILKEENLQELKFYILQKELTIENWNQEEITERINSIIQKMNENHITPKYYEITIINKNEITTAIKISNITEDFITEEVIEDILNNRELEDNKITYQYQN